MGRAHFKDYLGFSRYTETWYAQKLTDGVTECITIGFYSEDGGTSGEFEVKWVGLGGRSVPQLVAFDDSWHALRNMPKLMDYMARCDGETRTPEDFCAGLRSLGFRDITARVDPDEVLGEPERDAVFEAWYRDWVATASRGEPVPSRESCEKVWRACKALCTVPLA